MGVLRQGQIVGVGDAMEYFGATDVNDEVRETLEAAYEEASEVVRQGRKDIWTGTEAELALRLELLRCESLLHIAPEYGSELRRLKESQEYTDAKYGTYIIGGQYADVLRVRLFEKLRENAFTHIFGRAVQPNHPVAFIRSLVNPKAKPWEWQDWPEWWKTEVDYGEMAARQVENDKHPLLEVDFSRALLERFKGNLSTFFMMIGDDEIIDAWVNVYRATSKLGDYIIERLIMNTPSVHHGADQKEREEKRLQSEMRSCVRGMIHMPWSQLHSGGENAQKYIPPRDLQQRVDLLEAKENERLEKFRKGWPTGRSAEDAPAGEQEV